MTVEAVETVETVETAETAETVETEETVLTEDRGKKAITHLLTHFQLENMRC